MPFNGSDKVFKTPRDLENKFMEYLNYCSDNDKMPTQVGFCVYCKINEDTFYQYKNYEGYGPSLKKIDAALLDTTIQGMVKARNPAGYIFYLKNKFGWVDKQEITVDDKRVIFEGEDKIPD